jgi:mannosyltransferase
MEAAEALGRGGLSAYLEAIREVGRARSRAFWVVAGLTTLAALLRFATLGVQSYHHDEIVTAGRVLGGSFWHAMDAVGFSESTPPLYYALAWIWTQLTGTGEYGLRSLSALAGVATVPVAFLIGAELRGRRTGLIAAALVAVSPMLVWYSQEARCYALLVLLAAISLLYFSRVLEGGRPRDLVLWGIASGLALATHYFAIFPVAAEALWLLRRRGRQALPGLWIVAAAGALLAPLAAHQMSLGHAEWIGNHTLGHRLWESAVTFAVGETGDVIARPEHVLQAAVPLVAIALALLLLASRAGGAERRASARMLSIVAAAAGLPLAIALLDPGRDYVLARNLLPALVPLLVTVAIAGTLERARRRGAALVGLLVAYSLGFSIWAGVSPALQRPDWRGVAAKLGEAEAPRALVTWVLGEASLRYYLPGGPFQVRPSEGFDWFVHEVDFISEGPAPAVPRRLLGPGFRQIAYQQAGRLHIRRYAVPGSGLSRLRLGVVRDADLGFHSNGVLLDGIGPK